MKKIILILTLLSSLAQASDQQLPAELASCLQDLTVDSRPQAAADEPEAAADAERTPTSSPTSMLVDDQDQAVAHLLRVTRYTRTGDHETVVQPLPLPLLQGLDSNAQATLAVEQILQAIRGEYPEETLSSMRDLLLPAIQAGWKQSK